MTGFININKEKGVSSAKEVSVVKKLLNTPCGHLGTLDPLASGVLPIAIGNAARLFDYFLDKRKTYIAIFKFGADSDTLDITGNLRERAGTVPSENDIKQVLSEFIGEINQIPPLYSAKNISGKRGYELARAGVSFELPPKKVNIYSVELIGSRGTDGFVFKIECGGGTYIRSLARDIAARLGTVAVMSELKRTQSGIFNIDNAVKSKDLTVDNIKNFIIPTESVLPYESIFPNTDEAKKLFNGLSVNSGMKDGIYKIYNADGLFYGLAEVTQSVLRVKKKLC